MVSTGASCVVPVKRKQMADQACGVLRSGDLDTKSTDMVMRILIDLNRKHGITMVIVTHDIHLRPYADRILHLRDGKVSAFKSFPAFSPFAAFPFFRFHSDSHYT